VTDLARHLHAVRPGAGGCSADEGIEARLLLHVFRGRPSASFIVCGATRTDDHFFWASGSIPTIL
jgi:hypothetical protein